MKIARILNNGNEEYGIVKNNQWFSIPKFQRNNMGIENFITNPELIENLDITSSPIEINNLHWLPPLSARVRRCLPNLSAPFLWSRSPD